MIRPPYAIGLAAVALSALVMLGGCARPSDQAAEEAAEKAVESITGGKAEVEVDGDDTTVRIKGEGGGLTVGGGGSRPESAPADLPNLEGAHNFTWLNLGGAEMFSYEISGQAYREVCAAQEDLLLQAGWERSEGYDMEVEGVITRTFAKPGYGLMLTCGDNTEEGSSDLLTSIVLNRSKQ